jgi:bacillithiol biosynthesis cysteine-adding enzyme BshC
VDSSVRFIPHRQTQQFSSLVLDYLDGHSQVRNFYQHPPSLEGFRLAMESRKAFPTDRALLVDAFRRSYLSQPMSDAQRANLQLLEKEHCFTICTAHQPNIFSGYLYFIYKTVHVIRLAEELSQLFPDARFVPVFYIGSEDNDLDELSQFNLDGQKLRWQTRQTGAVGRMKVDKGVLALLDVIGGRLGVETYGDELMQILRNAYQEGITMAEATARLLNSFFASHGLLVLQPDDAALKKSMIPVFRNDLTQHLPFALVDNTSREMDRQYKSQVHPREINLFYLTDDGRYRILEANGRYLLDGSPETFTTEEILGLLEDHPERFSPNVVLRGLYQETILPNIAFVGGGSEIAYWLELKNLFLQFGVPFPVLILRNSFVLLDQRNQERISKLGWKAEELFESEHELMNKLVRQRSGRDLTLSAELLQMQAFYQELSRKVGEIDPTLSRHVEALYTRASAKLGALEAKMLRAEKRKFEAERRQLAAAREGIFPGGGFQERVDNFASWYARFGRPFIDTVVRHSPGLDRGVGLLEIR